MLAGILIEKLMAQLNDPSLKSVWDEQLKECGAIQRLRPSLQSNGNVSGLSMLCTKLPSTQGSINMKAQSVEGCSVGMSTCHPCKECEGWFSASQLQCPAPGNLSVFSLSNPECHQRPRRILLGCSFHLPIARPNKCRDP